MLTAFDQATFLRSVSLFKICLQDGHDHAALDFYGRTPMYGLRFCHDASVGELVDVLRAFVSAGANINHVDSLGDTLLLMSTNDNLGVALVQVGACISYEWQNYSKRALANAAAHGCTRTIDAMLRLRRKHSPVIDQKELDCCLDRAAKRMAYNTSMQDMSGIVKLVVDYGANPNTWNTLHYSAKRNHVLVQTLVSLGAETNTLAWDFYRGVKNTPLHRVIDMESFNVFEALVVGHFGSSGADFCNARDGEGWTPLMALMDARSFLYSDEHVSTRMNWLMGRGASCLPVDNEGRRLSSMPRSTYSPFRQLIDEKTREENWLKRKWIVLMRQRFVCGIRKKRRRYGVPTVVESVVGCSIEGIFRNIVTYL